MKCYAVLIPLLVLGSTATAQEHTTVQTNPAPSRTSQEAQNVALIMRFYEQAWQQDNFAFADKVFADDYIRHDASEPVQGPGGAESQTEIARSVDAIVPDLFLKPEVVLADGDLVAVRWTSTGTPAGVPAVIRTLVGRTGPVVSTGVNMYRIRDGQVVEIWNNRDDLTIRREMGMFRWWGVGGFVLGVVVTLLLSWAVRRRRRAAPTAAA